MSDKSALIVVDMQRYYLEEGSPYYRYFTGLNPGCLEYIIARSNQIVVPNIKRLIKYFRDISRPVIYLRLCGNDPDRRDIHPFFRETYINAKKNGIDNVYPLKNDPWSEVIKALQPLPEDIIVYKGSFSPFSHTDIDSRLRKLGLKALVFCGLATSQCVETTARDASDRGYETIHIEDAEADYDELTHRASLFSSQAVCGGTVLKTEDLINRGQ